MTREEFYGGLVRVYSDGLLALAVLSQPDGSRPVEVPLYGGFGNLENIRGLVGQPVTIVNETGGLVNRVFTQTISTSRENIVCSMPKREFDKKRGRQEEYNNPRHPLEMAP